MAKLNLKDALNTSLARTKLYIDTELAKKANSSHGTHLTLGTGSGNAFRGDYGNTAYNHSQAAHAPSNAQKNSDITKAEIEAKLTGAITSHTHSYLPLSGGTMTGLITTPNNSQGIKIGDDAYLCDRNIADHIIIEGNTATNGGITFGSGKDTNIYRGGANLLKTDDTFNAVGGFQWNGQSLDSRYAASSHGTHLTIGTGSGNAAAGNHTHTSIEYQDTSSVNTTPNDAPKGLSVHFKTNGTDGLSDGGTYHSSLFIKGWKDYSGGPYGNIAISANNNLWFRSSSSGTAWNDWRKVSIDGHTHNYLPFSGGTITGDIKFTDVTSTTYPAKSPMLTWNGSTDGADIYYQLDANDKGRLVLNTRDDNDCVIAFASNGTIVSTIDNSGNFSGKAATATTASKVGNSMKVQLNGGTTEGTNQFTFDGSAAKTINITPASIGAADSSHGTHLTLGTTSSTAYRGDYGNTAYQHSQAAHAPSNAQKNSDITKAEIESKLTGAITSHTHSYLPLSGGQVTGKIYMPANAAATSTDGSLPTQLAYGLLGAYGTLKVLGNTDTSTGADNEYVHIAAGWGLDPAVDKGITVYGTYANCFGKKISTEGHTHTSLTGVTSLAFATDGTDSGSISTTVDGTNTYFDFNLADDASQNDMWRWRFTPSGGTLFNAMTLDATSLTDAKLTVTGNVTATSFTENGTALSSKYAAASHGTHLTLGTGASNAAAGNHTHKYAGSSSAGGAANNSEKIGGYSLWVGTQAQYDAISSKSSTTIYYIKS